MNRALPLLLALAATTAGCAYYDDGLGSARYDGSTYLGDGYGAGYGYGGAFGSGWYDGFWYPGSGTWIYDGGGNRHRWRGKDRDWWRQHRGDRPGAGRPPPRGWEGRPPGGGWQGRPPGGGEDGRPPRWRGDPGSGNPGDGTGPGRPPRWRGGPGDDVDPGRPPRGSDGVRPGGPRPDRAAARPPRAEPRERAAPVARGREPNRNERPN